MKLTTLQMRSLLRAIQAKKRDTWIRAGGHGERVTLASLHSHRLVERRAWRGKEGEANAAYEYRATSQVIEAWDAPPKA